jgi:hypothetical protein
MQRPSGVYRKPQARAGRPLTLVSVAGWPRSFESVYAAANDGLGPVPATPAIVGNVRAQRLAASSGDGERAARSVRLSLERFCDDR